MNPRPLKRLGQHFLKDPKTVQRIVEALAPQPDETIVEIGPGTGALTSVLVERAGRVVAVEFDQNLGQLLRERLASAANFELVMGDALTTDFCAAIQPARQARLAANLPYNISTAILQRLIAQRSCITEMVVMLQREVVERVLAPAGSSERGFLSVLVEAYAETEKLFDVAPGAFRPPPKVWSSVMRLTFRSGSIANEELFWDTVSAGFAQKRKTILNNLRNASGNLHDTLQRNGGASIVLCKAGVELQRRAETLTIDEWDRIVSAMT
ncbi:MAG TPA: 16S rRNA (adenine(1518)-N(6)/adenine(1519)-N(6))-dimethyltransferase RsmA [Pyrinomonadaceae bacterium]|nr:16S rRNA (adenine(1518)-N(6)/adenine(1519)-N(6))-dimethyltransferase RsmA [Pyrinomonadaceae bacterium]